MDRRTILDNSYTDARKTHTRYITTSIPGAFPQRLGTAVGLSIFGNWDGY